MTNVVWLASYPKSGNTWLRILLSCLSLREDEPIDINRLPDRNGIASSRAPFDFHMLIDSGLMTHDEIDSLRPRLHEILARDPYHEDAPEAPQPVRFIKTHDAYTLTPLGEPLLAGARGAKGAIVIVRDPRDVAPSLANHNGEGIEKAIAFMNDVDAAFCINPSRQHRQFRQQLPGWSGHIASWLDQQDIPVHLIRYEDMQDDAASVFAGVLAFAGFPAAAERIALAVARANFAQLRQQESENGFREASRAGGGRKFFRRGETGGWRDELAPEQVARIEAEHAPMMRRLGYELSRAPARAGQGVSA